MHLGSVVAVMISALLFCSLLSQAHAQSLPVKISVGKGNSAKNSYAIKIQLANPKGSGYSIQSADITLVGQDATKYRAPPGWSAKYREGTLSFVAKSPLKAGASAVFEISSSAPIYSFRWNVASVGGTYVDSGTKNTNVSWPSAGIQRNYKWTFEGEEWTWNPTFPQLLYDYYKNKPRPPTDDYSVYVTEPYDDASMEGLVAKIREVAKERRWNDWTTINFIISFVQSLPYTFDNVTTPFDEYPRYPIETLVDNGGDCEDTSILTSELIRKLGYDTVLINPPRHMAVGVYCKNCKGTYYAFHGRNYYYLETTGENWQIGQIPDEYKNEQANIFPLVAKPIVTYEWKSSLVDYNDSYATYKIKVTIKNEGSETAKNFRTWVGFDSAEEGKVWAQITTDAVDLKAGESYSWDITLSPPRNQDTRIHVQVYGDNFSAVESLSKWFRT